MRSRRSGHLLILALFAGCSSPSVIHGQSPTDCPEETCATWSTHAGLQRPRADHSALVLRSGEVLVGGGVDDMGFVLPTELYDPVSHTSKLSFSFERGRRRPSLFELDNGDLLAFGDEPSVERFDGQRWSVVATFPFERIENAYRLRNGDWLVEGRRGRFAFWDGSQAPTVAPELARKPLASVIFPGADDDVIVVSWPERSPGADYEICPTLDVEGFRYSGSGYTSLPDVPNVFDAGNTVHSVHVLPDGRVFIFGGNNCDDWTRKTYVYDPATAVFARGPDIALDGGAHALSLPDGRVLLNGGASYHLELESLAVSERQPGIIGALVAVGCSTYALGGSTEIGSTHALTDVSSCP